MHTRTTAAFVLWYVVLARAVRSRVSLIAVVSSQNGVGLRSKTWSQGVFVDHTPPECSVIDGARGRPDFDFSTEGVPRVYVSCMDLESGTPRVRWGLGTIRGWDDAVRIAEAPVVHGLPVPAHLDTIYNETQSEYHKSPWRIMDAELVSLGAELLDGVRYVWVQAAPGLRVVRPVFAHLLPYPAGTTALCMWRTVLAPLCG